MSAINSVHSQSDVYEASNCAQVHLGAFYIHSELTTYAV